MKTHIIVSLILAGIAGIGFLIYLFPVLLLGAAIFAFCGMMYYVVYIVVNDILRYKHRIKSITESCCDNKVHKR